MPKSTIFISNRTQTVRLPAETRFPEHVKEVDVRVVGNERVISPADQIWDSFFLGTETVTDDFMTEVGLD